MPNNTHLDLVTTEAERFPEPALEQADLSILRADGQELAGKLSWLPNVVSSRFFTERCKVLNRAITAMFRRLDRAVPDQSVSDDFHWLHDNVRLLETELLNTGEVLRPVKKTPHVRTAENLIVPRIAAVAEGFLAAVAYQYSEQEFRSYIEGFQEITILKMKELWALVSVVKLVLLEQAVARGTRLLADPNGSYGVATCIRSLRDVAQTSWSTVLEELILFDRVLRQDPTDTYSRMDLNSRDLYRSKLAKIADRCDFTEMGVAYEALALAREAKNQTDTDPRLHLRRSHIGYYLLGEGVSTLRQKTGCRPSLVERVQSLLRTYPNEFYIPGIEILSFAIVVVILLPLVGPNSSLGLLALSLLALLIPSSQSAVQLMNYLVTALLPAQILPKLDFSEGIPNDCLTLVAVPALLINEAQVRKLVNDLEVRFLGNHDRQLYFALLTDLPDSRELPDENSPLVELCSELIRGLNAKYEDEGTGSFFLLHRHRVYNPRERVWMGWERKRGKLMDLNRLLRGQYDSFPLKVGDLSILPQVRFVITLDADTELPRGSAHRMIGTLAHPLNQAIIDAEKNIVVAGYGILQPRVGVSVESVAQSRLASIYSGETGLDIYSRAVSDVYQDLYGEGSFTGKGIYDVDIVHRVLDQRFPHNALLSHDLIEGAYARAGLASDIEVIEDYPSHYSAYNRRKHRWLRGDWQIAGWLLSWVPDEQGNRVRNPISLISQWKILDNLRRSLFEPATLVLLVFGWLVLPGSPSYWTVATIGILFVPMGAQFLLGLLRAAFTKKSEIARDALDQVFPSVVNVLLTLTFLAHQTLVSLDAIIRALVRRTFTRQLMLEWETAAEAELGVQRRTRMDTYLDWVPGFALVLGLLVVAVRRSSIFAALPILLLWACSKLVALWLNRPPRPMRNQASEKDKLFLRSAALRTWRYFAEFSNAEHNWLIPDNVQEEPASVAARFSPTNLGFLLNARQVACEFGFLTVPEFAEQTARTLETVFKLPRCRGHLLNWYDTRTLLPLPPLFVSSVDSGNLVASLWALEQGCNKQLSQPVLGLSLSGGLLDFLRTLSDFHALSRSELSRLERHLDEHNWLDYFVEFPDTTIEKLSKATRVKSKHKADAEWFANELRIRLKALKHAAQSYAPWWLPEFASLRSDPALHNAALDLPLERLPEFIARLESRLQSVATASNGSGDRRALCQRLLSALPEARAKCIALIRDLRAVASDARRLADEMDFKILLNPRRKLLSAGFDAESEKLHPACYDLLASESRTAVFVAIAKEDIPQESWFLLGRVHTVDHGRPVLLSWTGTMFEYLMPALWMRSYPNTLLERSRNAAVQAQQAYTAVKRVPWGISESAFFKMDEAGNYQYHAFGIPHLALRQRDFDALVISPYSSFLALPVDAPAALRNLRRMTRDGWFGAYGFYEAADFTPPRRRWRHRYELVRCWMAHHQGMSLLSIANFLEDHVVQRWFHADRRVQATELLLHEKPVEHVRSTRRMRGIAA